MQKQPKYDGHGIIISLQVLLADMSEGSHYGCVSLAMSTCRKSMSADMEATYAIQRGSYNGYMSYSQLTLWVDQKDMDPV